MENLHIEATKYTPQIDLDAKAGLLCFSGKSYPENTFDFYQPTMKWIQEFFEQDREIKSRLKMDIIYFNSSSSKLFFDLFDIIEEAQDAGNSITIEWFYDGENENALEAGEDFKEDFESLDFNLIKR
ncbi:MAG: DUF1987 domain-containing protein [Campylobacterota bacterium]|nr:DUF1987 domain-containing protein [Campylobacterota bacterium]